MSEEKSTHSSTGGEFREATEAPREPRSVSSSGTVPQGGRLVTTSRSVNSLTLRITTRSAQLNRSTE